MKLIFKFPAGMMPLAHCLIFSLRSSCFLRKIYYYMQMKDPRKYMKYAEFPDLTKTQQSRTLVTGPWLASIVPAEPTGFVEQAGSKAN
ncbi:hypothetical protein GALMADRAFT_248876 [Galerina marginata CBS 339.88]|uniref:Uncharacterized protein n=1 Tax=Galerina marginata (strain CBS 339.88) TaxID=685588 RepID=A0A067SVX6_GALM3|nr:hypothetical protein GALMADRAFT_248876 [Galerina marginata CBS 339.88]